MHKLLAAMIIACATGCIAAGEARTGDDSNKNQFRLEYTLVTDVFSWRQRATAFIIEFPAEVNSEQLKTSSFSILADPDLDGTYVPLSITSVMVNSVRRRIIPVVNTSVKGRFVVVNVDWRDAAATRTTTSYKGFNVRGNTYYLLVQCEDVKLINGTIVPKSGVPLKKTGEDNGIVDQFAAGSLESVKTGLKMDYRYFVPERKPGVKYPLLICLHGLGESAAGHLENEAQLIGNSFVTSWARDYWQSKHPSYVLAPQTRNRWDDANILQTVYELIITFTSRMGDIDAGRIYILGISMGGGGAYNMALAYPGMFAAAVPVCATYRSSDLTPFDKIVNMPVWIWHAADDGNVPVGTSRNIAGYLTKKGAAKLRYTELPPESELVTTPDPHRSWEAAVNSYELHEWLFAQRK